MKAKEDTALDDLARFVQVIGRDETLREPFCRLAALSPVQRSNAVHVMAEQMNTENKDRDLVSAFRLLADTRVFEAVMAALRGCGYIRT
jgi:hypothetical protein